MTKFGRARRRIREKFGKSKESKSFVHAFDNDGEGVMITADSGTTIIYEHMITLEGHLRGDTPPHVSCTCGWSFGPETRILLLGREAKNHSEETGHRLRNHYYG